MAQVPTTSNSTDSSKCTFEGNLKNEKQPTCIIVLGMAGSGKTTFVTKIVSTLYQSSKKPYVINLDPACSDVPYPANIGK